MADNMETKTVDELIQKYGLVSINNGANIKAWKNEDEITDNIIKTIKNNKSTIISRIIYLREEKEREQKEKQNKEYKHLKIQLPVRTTLSTKNDEKTKKLIADAEKIQYYTGPESDGLNLGISTTKNKLRSEAQKHCNHELETSFNHTYTADARKRIERTIICRKCGLYLIDTVSDALDAETILSM